MEDDTEPLPYNERHLPFEDRTDVDVWPNGARMAVILYITPEEWRWKHKEALGVRGSRTLPEEPEPSLSTRSAVKYGFDVGLPRLQEILDERDVKITLPTGAAAAKRHPDPIRSFHDAGHEINGHSYSEGTPPTTMSREEQVDDIEMSLATLEEVTDERPRGWLGPAVLSNQDTVDLLLENDMDYHCDLQDDELPYFIDWNDRTLVEIPYRMVGNINDFYLYGAREHRWSPSEATDYLKDTFDAYYRRAETRPNLFIYGTHPFVSGRPDSSVVFEDFLDYMRSHDDVWLTTYSEIADWWSEQFDDGYPV